MSDARSAQGLPDVTGTTPAEVRSLLCHDFTQDFPAAVEQSLGIDVVVVDMSGDGYLMAWPGRAAIIAPKTPNWFRQNFSIAHELGHLATDTACEGAFNCQGETDANRFAADLLMPEPELTSIVWTNLDFGVLADRIWRWGVSTDALRRRLDALKISPGADVLGEISCTTQAFLRRRWTMPPGPDAITRRMNAAATRRLPTSLITALELAVRQGRAPKASLAYALGVDESEIEIDDPPVHDSGLLSLLQG